MASVGQGDMVDVNLTRSDSTQQNKAKDGAPETPHSGDSGTAAAKLLADTSTAKPSEHVPAPQTENTSTNVVYDFAKSAVNAAIVDPVRAVAQIIDNSRQTDYDQKISSVANTLGLTPSAPAEFGTSNFFAQQLGNAAGMMVPFMLLRKGGGALTSKVMEGRAVAEETSVLSRGLMNGAAVSSESGFLSKNLLQSAGREAFASGATGLAYGTLLRTSENQDSNSNFWENRFKQGASDAATFGILGFTSPYVGKALDSAASSLERSTASSLGRSAASGAETALTADTNFATPLSARVLANTLRLPVVSGSIASLPAGLVNAETQAQHDGRWLPTGTELKENLVNMAFVGGAFGAAHSLTSRVNSGHADRSSNVSSSTEPVDRSASGATPEAPDHRADAPVVREAIIADASVAATRGDTDPALNLIQEAPGPAQNAGLEALITSGLPITRRSVPERIERETSTPPIEPHVLARPEPHFFNYIESGDWKSAAVLFESGALDRSIVDQPQVQQKIRDAFDQAVAGRKWDNIRDMLKFDVIPREVYASPDMKELAMKELVTWVGEAMDKRVAQVLDTHILTDSQLKASPELRDITIRLMGHHILRSDDFMSRYDGYSWVDTEMKRSAALDGIIAHVGWRDESASTLEKKARAIGQASDEEILTAGRKGVLKRIESGRFKNISSFGEAYFGKDWAADPVVRASAEKSVLIGLERSQLESANAAQQNGLLSPDFFNSEKNKEIAIIGLNKKILEHFVSPEDMAHYLEEHSRLFGEPHVENYRKSAVKALGAFVDEKESLDNYIKVGRNKLKVDFTPEEVRAAVRGRVTENLTFLDTKAADELAKVHNLSEEHIQDAAAAAVPSAILSHPVDPEFLARTYKLDEPRILASMHEFAERGYVSSALRASMLRGSDFNSALKEYAGVEQLTNDSARDLYEHLRKVDSVWADEANVADAYEVGAAEFGDAKMMKFAINPLVTVHDTLLGFDSVVSMYKKSGLSPEAFDGKILTQVARDTSIDEGGTAYGRLQSLAKGFPAEPLELLARARESTMPELRTLAESFPDDNGGAFANWATLKRFGKLQHLLEQQDTLEKIKHLEDNGQPQLAAWLKALMFHPDSRISLDTVMKFWQKPAEFLDLNDVNSGKAHALKKPSNYTDIPNLDLKPEQLRDALINGTLDKLQVFHPMRVEYDLAPNVDINKEFDLALGARREQRKGTAKNSQKLFSEVNRVLKADAQGYSVNDLVGGKEPPPEVRQKLLDLLYNGDIGVPKPAATMKLIAEIHRKSDPIAVLAGDDTVSCMGFGSGKNNIYMFNPNDAQFTVRIVNQEGKVRTFAQSVLTKDKDVGVAVPKLIEKMQGNDKAHMHDVLSADALQDSPSVLAADNIEVHPKYAGPEYQNALQSVYTDFFNRYLEEFGQEQNLRRDKMVVGLGYTDALKGLPQEPNTYVPQAPVAYSDKTHETVFRLDMDRKTPWTATPTKIEIGEKTAPTNSTSSSVEGIAPLTFEDTLPVAWLESKAYQDNPSMIEGLHNLENSLIAQAINNTAKDRPNLSLKYTTPDGKPQGYLLGYEGEYGEQGKDKKPVIFISDYSTDRQIGRNGAPKAGRAGGKLLQGFMEIYKRDYLDHGNLIPVLANAREETSYKLLKDNLKVLSKRIGYEFDIQEVGTHQSGTSTMHDLLIVPKPKK